MNKLEQQRRIAAQRREQIEAYMEFEQDKRWTVKELIECLRAEHPEVNRAVVTSDLIWLRNQGKARIVAQNASCAFWQSCNGGPTPEKEDWPENFRIAQTPGRDGRTTIRFGDKWQPSRDRMNPNKPAGTPVASAGW